MINLDAHERLKFATWYRQDAGSNKAITEQMEKLGLPHVQAVAKHKRQQMAACLIVAEMLESIEEMTIEPEPRGVT